MEEEEEEGPATDGVYNSNSDAVKSRSGGNGGSSKGRYRDQ